MTKIFFRKKSDNESQLYRDLRDNPKAADIKSKIENLWEKYEPYAHKSFLKKIQIEFYQRWWEMYLFVGLDNIKCNLNYDKSDKGPDFFIPCKNNKIWIEAVAPKIGDKSDKVPEFKFEASDLPKDKCLLRLSQKLNDKRDIFEKHILRETIGIKDICVIALSSCNLNQFGTLLDFPQPAPLSVLAGAGVLCLSKKPQNCYTVKTKSIYKNSGAQVDMCLFDEEKFSIISAVLYSSVDPLNAPNDPESTFQIFLNPNAKNPLPAEYKMNIETWYRNGHSKSEDKWIKT